MYKYIGTKNFANLIKDNNVLEVPSTIEETYSFSELPDITKWNIGDTDDKLKALTWHELKNDTKTILICDRVLVKNISLQDLNDYLVGKRIAIDNEDFICRLIYSGTEYEDRYNGTKNKNEWDYIIGGNQQIVGLPAIYGESVKYHYESIDYQSTHNLFWGWAGIGTITSNFKDENVIVRGANSPDFIFEKAQDYRGNDIGWRPVLEKVVQEPVIEADRGRLGEFTEPFVYKYTLKSYNLNEDVLNTVIKLDGNIIEQGDMQANIQNELNLGDYWEGLYKGRHTIEIHTVNNSSLEATTIASFNTPAPTFVDKEGLDYFARQLWNTKIKTFVADFSKRQGGLVLDANETFVGDGQIEENKFADCGKAIISTIDTTPKTVAKFSTDAIKLGKHGVALRGKVDNRLEVETIEVIINSNANGSKTEIGRRKFKSSDFKTIDKFCTVYMSFEYDIEKIDNQVLEVEVNTLSSSTTHTFKLDYVLISAILPGVMEG